MIRETMALQYLQSFLKQVPYDNPNTMILSFFISMLVFMFKLTRRRRSKMNLPPSPPKLPFIGNLHQLGTLPHRSIHELSQKYGPLLLLHLGHLPLLVVSSAELAREVMQTHDTVFANRPNLTSTKNLLYGCNDLAFASYGEAWRQKRKLCVLELLSLKRVQSLKFIIEEEVEAMVEHIRISNRTCSVNLSEMLIATTNNIICRCMFRRKYDVEGSRFGQLVRKVMTQLTDISVGDLFPLLGWIDVLRGQIKKFKATFAELDAFFDQVIAERKMAMRGIEKKKDFLDILLQIQEGGMSEFELTQDELKALILDMFLAGTDTSSTAIEWAMAELVKNPPTMKKVQEEVRRVVGDKSKIEDNDVNQMEFMKCVLKETLRLHPPAPLLVPRETISSVRLGGCDIPSKTMVYINAWAIQRDPELWENPEAFIPERFENSKVSFNGQDFKFIPFGSGRRNCVGMAFGLASSEYMLANLLCWFDWKLPGSGQDLDMTENFGVTANKKVPLYLEAIPHNNLGTPG